MILTLIYLVGLITAASIGNTREFSIPKGSNQGAVDISREAAINRFSQLAQTTTALTTRDFEELSRLAIVIPASELLRISRPAQNILSRSAVSTDEKSGIICQSFSRYFNGYCYAVMDECSFETNKNSDVCSSCQVDPMTLPDGWEIAPDDSDIVANLAKFPWGTDILVFSSGNGFGSASMLGNSGTLLYTGMLAEDQGNYNVLECDMKVVMRQQIDNITPNVSSICNVAVSTELSRGSCGSLTVDCTDITLEKAVVVFMAAIVPNTEVTVELLSSTCTTSASYQMDIYLDDAFYGSIEGSKFCNCRPGSVSQTFVTDVPASRIRVVSTGTAFYRWVKISMVFPDGTSREKCVIDTSSSNCKTADICVGGITSGTFDATESLALTAIRVDPENPTDKFSYRYFLPDQSQVICVVNNLDRILKNGPINSPECTEIDGTFATVSLNRECSDCLDHDLSFEKMALVSGIDISSDPIPCKSAAFAGSCTSHFGKLVRTFCPTSCKVLDDNETLVSLVQSHVPEYADSVKTCADATAITSCLDEKYGPFLQEICPCHCSDQLVSFIQGSP